MNKSYSSRKFIVTMTVILGALGVAVIEKLTGPLSAVLIAGVGAYNYAQGRIDEKSND